MKHWIRFGLAFAGIVCSAASSSFDAHAQSAANLIIDAAGVCPRQEDLLRINPALDDPSATALMNRMATPSRSGIRVYRAQNLTEPVIQGFILGFDDDVEVLAGTPLGQRGPALVRRVREPLCGWVNVGELERFVLPMLLRDVPGFEHEVDRISGESRLEARVIVKNRLNRQTGYAQRAPLFNAPFVGDTEPEPRSSVGYFEVLSVFNVQRAAGGRCRTFHDADCFLRVGSTTTTGSTAGVSRTRGWMRGQDVEIWPSALAIYYGSGRQGLKIHLTEPSARIGTPFTSAGAREAILAYQPEGRFEEPRERNIMRFPVIRGTAFAEPNAPQRPTAPSSVPPASYNYEIVFNGQACIDNTSGGQGDCIPEPQIKDEVARLGQAVRAISNIDVLFVVDATESMGPYLQSVVRALRIHVGKATGNRQWSFRYSVVVYGDYNRKREGGLDYYALPFSNDLTGLDPLQKAGVYDDENKDIPEAPFAALERAASEVQWRPEAANRLIIWIADHGNRAPGKYTTPAGELIEVKTAKSVVDAIKATDARLRGNAGATGGGTKTHFLAIQVKGGASAASEQYFQQFRRDADAIRQGLGESTFTTIPSAINRGSTQDQSALVSAIATQLDQSVDAVAEARQIVQGALGGDTTGRQGNLPASALLAREFLAQLGFSSDRLREMGRRIQIVRNGFVFQSVRNSDYRYWLGLRQPEFADVRDKARALCENLRYADRVNVVDTTIMALVRAVTFSEMRPNETVRAFYTRILSVPSSDAISPMLGEGTPADFMRRWTGWTPAEREQKLAGVCKKARMLQYIGEGLIVDERNLVFDRNDVKLRSGIAPKDFDWRWITADAQTVWFFIPMDVLP